MSEDLATKSKTNNDIFPFELETIIEKDLLSITLTDREAEASEVDNYQSKASHRKMKQKSQSIKTLDLENSFPSNDKTILKLSVMISIKVSSGKTFKIKLLLKFDTVQSHIRIDNRRRCLNLPSTYWHATHESNLALHDGASFFNILRKFRSGICPKNLFFDNAVFRTRLRSVDKGLCDSFFVPSWTKNVRRIF